MNDRRRQTKRLRVATRAVATAVVLAVALSAAPAGCGSAGSQISGEASPASAAGNPGTATPSPGASVTTTLASPDATASASSVSAADVPSPAPSPEPPLDRPTKKRPLRIYFGGDSLAGMPGIMLHQLTTKNGLAKVRADYVECSRLTCDDPVDWQARVKQQISSGRTDIGIFMIGANDSGMPMVAGGESVMYPARSWLDEYERRAKKISAIMLRGGADRVYWVGMPIMPSQSESKKMRDLNELFEDVAASSPDVVYVDSYDLLAKKNGDFKAALRSGDGVHYTNEGAMVVAQAVWKAIKEDWGGR